MSLVFRTLLTLSLHFSLQLWASTIVPPCACPWSIWFCMQVAHPEHRGGYQFTQHKQPYKLEGETSTHANWRLCTAVWFSGAHKMQVSAQCRKEARMKQSQKIVYWHLLRWNPPYSSRLSQRLKEACKPLRPWISWHIFRHLKFPQPLIVYAF